MTEWCSTCRRQREVEYQFATDSGDRYHPIVEEHWVIVLTCGHAADHLTGTRRRRETDDD